MARVHHFPLIASDRADGFRFLDGGLAGQRRQVAAVQWFCGREIIQHGADRRRQTGQIAIDQGRE